MMGVRSRDKCKSTDNRWQTSNSTAAANEEKNRPSAETHAGFCQNSGAPSPNSHASCVCSKLVIFLLGSLIVMFN